MAAELGESARFVRADVSDAGQAEQAIKAASEAFGALHICVNCAGIGDPQKIIGKEGPADLARFQQGDPREPDRDLQHGASGGVGHRAQ